MERDAESSYLASEVGEADPMDQLRGASIIYRVVVEPNQGRKVFTLQTLPAWDDAFGDEVGKVAGSSLHAGVAAKADERQKLEGLVPVDASLLIGVAGAVAAFVLFVCTAMIYASLKFLQE